VSRGRSSLTWLVVRLLAFVALSGLLSTIVVASLLNLDVTSSHPYHALFTDASDLQPGDPVRIAGVKVGRVDSVSLQNLHEAKVTFQVDDSQPVTTTTGAAIEFENLFGQHSLSLTGTGTGPLLAAGATIPLARTKPALDLTDLFNGFQPLFQALTPDDVNQLTANIIGTFQGQSGSLSALIDQAGTLTNNLADHQQVIDSVVDNLTSLLGVIADHDDEVGQLIDNFDTLSGQLAGERQLLGSALGNADGLVSSLASETGSLQPPLENAVQSLTSVTGALAADQQQVSSAITVLPSVLTQAGKVVQNGSFVSVYYCSLAISIPTPVPLLPDPLQSVFNSLFATLGAGQVPYLGGVVSPSGQEGNPNAHTPNCAP
jgi:phospholipid/cholesterol/gamma-HCH transport system substrate-binding protein